MIEMMKTNGNDSWKSWDKEMIAWSSTPKLNALYESGDVCLEMYGFRKDGPLTFIHVDVRGCGNPIPALRSLCGPRGWSVAERCKDGEFLDLAGASEKRWNEWQEYLKFALEQAERSQDLEN